LKKRIMIVAGEASGDHHGASLVREVIRQQGEVEFYGIGGRELRASGVKTEFDSSTLAVIGVWEVLARLRQVFKAWSWVKTELKSRSSPDLVVLIDFPDFNFRVAREAKKRGIPVLYYISPQVWAWRRGRVKIVARTVDKMLVIFPFEVDFYRKYGVQVEYVGHPLMEGVGGPLSQEAAREKMGLPQDGICVGLLPGSRTSEVNHILPTMLGAAEIILRTYPEARFVLPLAATLRRPEIDHWLNGSPVPIVVERDFNLAVKACTVALVTSGTATLQTALLDVPMVIAYKVAPMSYLIGRLLIRVDFIGMVNLIAGREIARELVQHQATPHNLASACLELLNDPSKQVEMKRAYEEVRKRLGEGKASCNAARAVLEMI
jgi:lipid-A-disaccharide synthase